MTAPPRAAAPPLPFVRRFLGFSALPLFSALAPFLLLPIVARIGGASGWSSIALGQAIGGFCATAISFGWNVTGPPLVAGARTPDEARDTYALSFWSRALLFLAIAPLAAGAAAVLSSPGFRADGAGMSLSMCVAGLAMDWYAIGRGRPGQIAAYDAAPRLAATAAAVPLVLATGTIYVYPLLLVGGSLLGLGLFHRSELGRVLPARPGIRALRAEYPRRWHAALVEATGALYVGAPVPVVAATSGPLASARFASADKAYRYGLFAVTALGNALQSWVAADPALLRRRQWQAIAAHAVLGLAGLGILGLVGPWLTGLLFGAHLRGEEATLLFYGLAYLAVSTSTPLIRNVHIPAGRSGTVLVATTTSAVVGVLLMLFVAPTVGPSGVALAFALSETLVLLLLAPSALRSLRA